MAFGLGNVVATVSALVIPELDKGFASKLSESLGKTADEVGGNFGKRLGNAMGSVGGTLTKGVTAPVVGIASAAVAAGMSVDEAFDSIRIKTGATGSELLALQDSFKNVAKTTPAELSRIAEVMSDIEVRTGLAGKPLEDLTAQFVQLENLTGNAVDVNTLTRVFTAFNIPAEQAGDTLDRLFRASQSSGVEFNTLTNLLVSQSAAFSELGFGLDETTALLAQFEKSGVNTTTVLAGLRANIIASTKGGEDLGKVQGELAKAQGDVRENTVKLEAAQAKYNAALKKNGAGSAQALSAQASLITAQNNLDEATQRASDAQTKLAEATKKGGGAADGAAAFFQAGVKQIEGFIAAGDDAAAQAAAKDLFGAKTFLDALDAIKRGQFNIDDTLAAIQGGGDTIGGVALETADFAEQMKVFKNSLNLSLGELGTKLFPVITDAINTLLPPVIDLVDRFAAMDPATQGFIVKGAALAAALGPVLSIVGKVTGAISGIGKVIPIATKGFGALSKGFGALMSMPPIAWGVILGVVAIAAIVVLIIKHWDDIKAFFKDMAEAIKDAWDATIEFLGDVVRAAVRGIKAAWNKLVDIITWPIRTGVRLATNILDGITKAVEAVIDWVRDHWKLLLAIITGPFGLAVLAITENWDTIKGAINSALDFIRGIVSNAVDGIKLVWDGITAVITAPFELAKTIIDGFITFIKNGLQTLKDVAESILGPIGDVVGNIVGAIGDVGGFVTDAIPGLATGGPVQAGRPYLVGEKGPELIVPRAAGVVIPNHQLGALNAGSTYNVVVNNPVAEPASTSIPRALRRATQLRG